MAAFVLHDYDYGEPKLSFIPQFKKDEFISVLMFEYNNPGEPVKITEHSGTFDYDDVVLLRDFLTSVIDLYDKEESEEGITKRGISGILNNKSLQ